MKNPVEALRLSERKLGRKICIGLLIPIAIMLLNLLYYLIWREEDVSVFLSMCVFLIAQFVVLAVFTAVRFGIRRYRGRRNPEKSGETA